MQRILAAIGALDPEVKHQYVADRELENATEEGAVAVDVAVAVAVVVAVVDDGGAVDGDGVAEPDAAVVIVAAMIAVAMADAADVYEP